MSRSIHLAPTPAARLLRATFAGALLAALQPELAAAPRLQEATTTDAAAVDARHIETLSARGLHPLAAKEARRFLERYPKHAEADRVRYRLATALAAQQQLDEARELFAALSKRSGFALAGEAAQRLGQLEFEAGRLEPACAAFARALELGPAYLRAGAAQMLGESEYRRERWSEADAAWERVLREAGDTPDAAAACRSARAGRAWCAFQLQRWDDVVARVEQCAAASDAEPAAESTPERPGEQAELDELWLLAGDAHTRAHRPAEARAAYARVRSAAHAEPALRGAAYAALDSGDTAGATAAFTELLRKFPRGANAADAAIQLGALRLRGGDARGALQLLSSAPLADSAEAQYWRARAERELGRAPQALATLERALALAPQQELLARIQALRGQLLLADGRTQEAREALAATGTDAGLQSAMVDALNGGNAALAAELARELVTRFPDSAQRAEAELVLAEELFQRKDYAAALAAFDALERGRATPELQRRAAVRAAWSAWLGGDRAGAATRFSALEARCAGTPEAAELRTARARCQVELAEERRAAGDHAGAADAWRGAIAADPAVAPRARLGLAWALYEAGAADDAAQAVAACLAEDALDADQRAEALELRVWTLVKSGSPARAAEAWRAYANARASADARVDTTDELRRANAARAVANALADARDPSAAVALLDECLRGVRASDNALPLLEDATWFALGAEHIDDAAAHARAAAKAAPRDEHTARACRAVADAFLARKDAQRALEWYELASRAPGAERAAALYGAAWCKLEANDARGARETLDALLELPDLGPLAARAQFLAGQAAWKRGELARAAQHYRAALEAELDATLAPHAWLRVAEGELEAGRAPAALDALARLDDAIRKSGASFDARDEAALTRGRALLAADRASEGTAQLEQLAASAPSVWSARAELALAAAAEARGDEDDALSRLIKLSSTWGGEAERSRALLDAGRLFERRGDTAQALAHYDELLDAHKTCALAAEASARVQALRRATRAQPAASSRRR